MDYYVSDLGSKVNNMAAVNLKLSLTLFLGVHLAFTSVECIPSLEAGPQNKTIIDGMRASFICDVNDDNDGTIFWTFSVELGRRWFLSNNGYIYPHRDRNQSDYRVTIDRQRKIYELILLSPSISIDTGIYECGYEFGPNRKYAVLAMATLTIVPLSDSLTCQYTILPMLSISQDQEVEVTCSWTHDQAGAAYFEKSSGETAEAGLRYSNSIVGRFTSDDVPGIMCLVGMLDNADIVIKTACTMILEESKREQTIDITMTSKINDVVTQRTPDYMPGFLIAIIIIPIIIVALIMFIVVMVVKRRRKSTIGKHQTMDPTDQTNVKQPMYDTVGPTPHTTLEGSTHIYALSFKDKKVKKNCSGKINTVCEESHYAMMGGSSTSCGILNIQPSSTAEQVYAEPDIDSLDKSQGHGEINFQGTRNKSASLPFLDINEYETFSDASIDPALKAKTLSALSVTSLTKSNRKNRWSSQRMTKLLSGTPPRARHALSLRRPTRKDPNVDSDYTKMTIEKKQVSAANVVPTNMVPLNTEPDQVNRVPSHHEYAGITKAFDRNPSNKEEEVVDNYSGEINGPFAAPIASYAKRSKSASIHRMTSACPPPPNPQRGKCQSEFLGNASYCVISDYETMSEQEARVNDADNDDCAGYGDDGICPLHKSFYDHPRGTGGGRATVGEPPENGDRATVSDGASHTLPRISEGGIALTDPSGRKGQRAKSVSSNQYELVGDDRAIGVLQSPCYADIEGFTYATVSDKPPDGSEM